MPEMGAGSTATNYTYTRNIEIRDLPAVTNNLLNTLARLRGIPKWKIVKEALIEYAERHRDDIAAVVGAVETAKTVGDDSASGSESETDPPTESP